MSSIRFIGDIHGKNKQYLDIVSRANNPTIQVGDYGSGFVDNPITKIGSPDRFIRGNHDNLEIAYKQHNFIKDGTIEEHSGVKIGFIGGASSIDRMFRTAGKDWWPDEQLSIKELSDIFDKFINEKPEVIVSHECPEFVSNALVEAMRGQKYIDDNRTRVMLQELYYYYTPKLHIFGHWHYDFDWLYKGTRFICLNELSFIDIDLSNLDEYNEDEVIRSYYRGM